MNAVRRRVDREVLAAPAPGRREVRLRAVRWPVAPAVLVDRALPDALEVVARSLRSGASLQLAIAEAAGSVPAPLDVGFASIASLAERGRPLADAIDEWASTTPGDGVALAAAALALAAEIGGAAARSLDGVADTLRDRNGLQREVRALSSQARASALVVALAPLAFAALAALADPRNAAFLLTAPVGLVCLTAGAVLDGIGLWWMHGIVQRASRDRDPVTARQADVIDLFALALGAGLNLRLAIDAVARRAPPSWAGALVSAADHVDRGRRVAETLETLPVVLGEPARPLVRVLVSAERYGSPLLPALERLAVDARLDRRRRAEESARRVPVKLLFPLVLCVLPAFALLTVAPLLAGALDALRL